MSDDREKSGKPAEAQPREDSDGLTRRDFIRLGGYTGAALSIPLALPIIENNRAKPITSVSKSQYDTDVLVLGSGIAGLLHIKLGLAKGAGMVVATDLSKERLELARRYGAQHVFTADADIARKFRKLNNGSGADVVIVCAAAEPVYQQAFAAVGRGGVILLFAPTPADAEVCLSVNDVFWRRDQSWHRNA